MSGEGEGWTVHLARNWGEPTSPVVLFQVVWQHFSNASVVHLFLFFPPFIRFYSSTMGFSDGGTARGTVVVLSILRIDRSSVLIWADSFF